MLVAKDVLLLTVRPAAPLRSIVECIWHHEGTAAARGRERVLPNGRFQIVLNLAAATGAICGLRSQHVVVDTAQTSWVMGVVFRPGGALGCLQTSAVEFYDSSVPLDGVWGAQANRLLEQLCEAASAEQRLRILERTVTARIRGVAEKQRAIHPAVGHALRAFHNSPRVTTVAQVSQETGWSRRWFSHSFREQVGMTPKSYCRLIRFQKVIQQIAADRRVDWTEVALACGYCDQAHLVHEFRAFSGLTPERFVRAERPFPNHVRAD